MPVTFVDDAIMNLYDDAFLANLPSDIAHEILLSKTMTTENDWLVAISEAKARAAAEGLKEGRETGRKEGREEGREEGMAIGKAEVAMNLLKMGMSATDISKATGLSIEQINAL